MTQELDRPSEAWPAALPLEAWNDTYATLHRWLQIVGKVRLTQSPWVNHSWNATLYVTARGLTTTPIPFGGRHLQIDFDFIDHALVLCSDPGSTASLHLEPQSVSTFYRRLSEAMDGLGFNLKIHRRPNEVADAIPFDQDDVHASYDRDQVQRYWRVLTQADRVLKQFRARFIGKSSPVHLFWGSADLAVTRFSGRTAPRHPGGIPNLPDWITREAYSHEVSSCGFWAGGGLIPYAAFYAYAYPQPPGFADARVSPQEAFYNTELGEFILPYDAVRQAASPDDTLLEFLQSTYSAAADLADWDRHALERAADPRTLHRAR